MSFDRETTVGVSPPSPNLGPQTDSESVGSLDQAISRVQRQLLARQEGDGHWCAELEGDSILESEYIFVMQFLDRLETAEVGKAAAYLRRQQLPHGGWSNYPGGDADVSATVKAYFALKLVGDDPEAEHMARARRVAVKLGGLSACNSYTKLYMALFGQYPWDGCPAVPPEMILLPEWAPFNIYAISAWSRAIVVPLSMIWAYRPICPIPQYAAVPELAGADTGAHRVQATTPRELIWATFFQAVDGVLRWLEKRDLRPLREAALDRCEAWILERLGQSDGLAAIFPPIVNAILALRCRGYDVDHPAVLSQIEALERLIIEESDSLRLQPCKSPVWDTAQALCGLLQSGFDGDDPAVVVAADWLLAHEVRTAGDWRVRNPTAPIGGWYFEYANEFYPDCDDTAEVLSALSRVESSDSERALELQAAIRRGRDWLLAMQNEDGGWASFDRDCDLEVLTFVPFADHNAMIDPSTVDISSRALEALRSCGLEKDHPAIERGVDFILRQQEPDGSWYGRWGANYIYGTWLALSGLQAAGFDMGHEACRAAADWLLSRQNKDGGWGESLRSYDEPDLWKGRGESTATQTAWALLGILAARGPDDEAVSCGVDYLLGTQSRADGTWRDEPWTGTGFPSVFYLNYHFYPSYFPLLALSAVRCARAWSETSERVA